MASVPVILSTTGIVGTLARARIYNAAGGTETDVALTESPANSGQFVFAGNVTLADNAGPYTWEAREVLAQDATGFTNSTEILRTQGLLGWVRNGVVMPVDLSGVATPADVQVTVEPTPVTVNPTTLDNTAVTAIRSGLAQETTVQAAKTAAEQTLEAVEGIEPAPDLRGPGAYSVTIKLWANSPTNTIPLADADVWITQDENGTNTIAGTLQTNSDGEVTFLLDNGVTYYAWAQKDGANPIRAFEFVAVAD